MKPLLDTDVLIDHFRGVPEAGELLIELAAASDSPAVSVITLAEIEAGLKNSERERVEPLLAALRALPVDSEIAHKAGRYRAVFGKTHGVLLPDALIAATAARHGCTLYTLNAKHYPMDEVRVTVPYTKT